MESSTPALTSFPLEKFSHSSSAPTSPSHQWNHESKRDGLYLVFQKMRLQSNSIEPVQERFVMSITSGGNVLERQDIGDLVDFTRNFESMSQTMALNTSRIDAPVQIVVKRPCIAMRYTKDPTKVRRIQVRFKNDLDYENSLNIFRDLGLPIKDAVQIAPQAPAPSEPITQVRSEIPKEVVSRHAVLTPNLYTAQMKESDLDDRDTEHSAVSLYRGGDRPHSTSTETLRSSSAASQHWLPPDRMDRPFSSLAPLLPKPAGGIARQDNKSPLYVNQTLGSSSYGVSSDLSGGIYHGQNQGQNYLPSTFSVFGQRASNASTSARSVEQIARPIASTLIAPSEMHSPLQSPYAWASKAGNAHAHSEAMSSIYLSQMRAETVGGSARSSPSNLAYGPFSAQSEPESSVGQDFSRLERSVSTIGRGSSAELFTKMRNSSLPMKSYSEQIPPRPQSVPIIPPSSYDTYLLPPKRELTFLKERENAKLRNQSTPKVAGSTKSGNAASTKDPTSLPSPTFVEPKKPVRRVAERNKKNSTPREENESVAPAAREEIDGLPIAEAKEFTYGKEIIAISETQSIAPSQPSKSAAASSKRPSSAMEDPAVESKRQKMVDHSTQTQTLSGRNHTAPIITLPVNIVSTSRAMAPISPPPSVLDQIDDFVRTNASRPTPIDVWQPRRYSEASEEGRRVMVNGWICDNVENDDFLKLCEDVGHTWQRVGMGF